MPDFGFRVSGRQGAVVADSVENAGDGGFVHAFFLRAGGRGFAQAFALSVAVIGGVDSAGPLLLLIPDLLLTVIWCLIATAAVSLAGEAERLADLPTRAEAATIAR